MHLLFQFKDEEEEDDDDEKQSSGVLMRYIGFSPQYRSVRPIFLGSSAYLKNK